MFFRCYLALLLILTSLSYSQSDEEAIREIFEKTTGTKTFSLTVIPIKEGLTNRNYKVIVNGAPFFVRLGHKDPQSLRIDRVKERALYTLAEKAGIAPRLLYSDTDAGNLVAPFIQGTAYGKKGGHWLYERKSSIQRIATLLRRYHRNAAPQDPKIDYPFQIIDDYIQEAHTLLICLPKDMDRALEIVQRLKAHTLQQKKVLCHQDLVPDNFIFDEKTLYLVDWEYAEWSNPYYDLASICIEHGFDEEEKRMLLGAYFRRSTEKRRCVLEMMCMLYSMRDCLWYILENRRSPHEGGDFLQLANEHYQNFFTSLRWLEDHHISLM